MGSIDRTFELILVNDGCPQNSWAQVHELSKEDSRVRGINLSRNFGQHKAITAGLDHARGEWIVVMDGDLQEPPEEIPHLFEKTKEGFFVVLASRTGGGHSILKRLSSKSFYKVLSYLTDTPQDSSISNFGVYHRQVIDTVISMRENLRYFPVLIRWAGFPTAVVPVKHAVREVGESSYTLMKLIRLAIEAMLAFSDKPLRLTVKLGFLISLSSLFAAAFLCIRALYGKYSVTGWPSLIVSVWLLGGLIILLLGILGTYVGRIFDEVKRRPLYAVQNCTDNDVQPREATK